MKCRRALALCGCCVALALGAHVARGVRASASVDREIAGLQRELDSVAVIEPQREPSAELLAARAECTNLLDWVAALGPADRLSANPLGYWVPEAPAEYRAELRVRLERHRAFFDGLDGLPAELWEDRFAVPNDGLDPSSTSGARRFIEATHALCARAWLAVQEPDGTELAGRSLARALAIARVTDAGLASNLCLRERLEQIVLEALERCGDAAPECAAELAAPVRAELECSLGEDRFRICVVSEAQRFSDGVVAARSSGMPAWLSGADDSERAIAHLAMYRELLSSVAAPSATSDDGERCACPRRGDDVPNHLLWRSMTALDFRLRKQLSTALRTI